jgi:hypothetical protein
MANSVYQINKGINKSIEFKGLKAQYIWYLGAGLMALLILYSGMYILGVNTFIALGIIVLAATFLIIRVYAMSNKYGEHGMMKALAKKSVPRVVKIYSRKVFLQLEKQYPTKKRG